MRTNVHSLIALRGHGTNPALQGPGLKVLPVETADDPPPTGLESLPSRSPAMQVARENLAAAVNAVCDMDFAVAASRLGRGQILLHFSTPPRRPSTL